MDTPLLLSIISLAISAGALVVAIFRPALDRWYANRWGTQADARYQYIEYPNPQGRIGSTFVLMTIENMTDHPITIESLQWRLSRKGPAIAVQGSIQQYDKWKSAELPVVLPLRHSYAEWYHPTSISGEPSWEMDFVDRAFSRDNWHLKYRNLQLYFVVSPSLAFPARMPEAFYRRIREACEHWDRYGWPQERRVAAAQQASGTRPLA